MVFYDFLLKLMCRHFSKLLECWIGSRTPWMSSNWYKWYMSCRRSLKTPWSVLYELTGFSNQKKPAKLYPTTHSIQQTIPTYLTSNKYNFFRAKVFRFKDWTFSNLHAYKLSYKCKTCHLISSHTKKLSLQFSISKHYSSLVIIKRA